MTTRDRIRSSTAASAPAPTSPNGAQPHAQAASAFSRIPQLNSIKAVAKRLDVSTRSVRRLIDQGLLPHHRIGGQIRISDTDLLGYIVRSRR